MSSLWQPIVRSPIMRSLADELAEREPDPVEQAHEHVHFHDHGPAGQHAHAHRHADGSDHAHSTMTEPPVSLRPVR